MATLIQVKEKNAILQGQLPHVFQPNILRQKEQKLADKTVNGLHQLLLMTRTKILTQNVSPEAHAEDRSTTFK